MQETAAAPHAALARDVLEVMGTARTIHRYRPDPIPDEDLGRMLWAATRAPSGTNRQPFRFLVLRDGPRAKRAKAILGDAFRQGWGQKESGEGWDRQGDTRRARSARAMQQFVDRFEQIPVVVLACWRRERPLTPYDGASIYPACQNLLLAARALGYGACFSMWHAMREEDLRRELGIPDDVFIAVTITVGRPEGRHGPLRRLPLRHLVFDDGWEQPAEWAVDPEGSRFSRPRD